MEITQSFALSDTDTPLKAVVSSSTPSMSIPKSVPSAQIVTLYSPDETPVAVTTLVEVVPTMPALNVPLSGYM